MDLKIIDREFSICKVDEIPADMLKKEFTFIATTNDELSIICETKNVPEKHVEIENGWCCFRIAEDASFEKYGMIAFLANIIAANKTSTLVVGTFDTDYLFIKKERFEQVKMALTEAGCRFIQNMVTI